MITVVFILTINCQNEAKVGITTNKNTLFLSIQTFL